MFVFGWTSGSVGIFCVTCFLDFFGWCPIKSLLLKIVMCGRGIVCLGECYLGELCVLLSCPNTSPDRVCFLTLLFAGASWVFVFRSFIHPGNFLQSPVTRCWIFLSAVQAPLYGPAPRLCD